MSTNVKVKRTCNRCYGTGVSIHELEQIEIVSRYGTAHKTGDTPDKTNCGIYAGGPTWWRKP